MRSSPRAARPAGFRGVKITNTSTAPCHLFGQILAPGQSLEAPEKVSDVDAKRVAKAISLGLLSADDEKPARKSRAEVPPVAPSVLASEK